MKKEARRNGPGLPKKGGRVRGFLTWLCGANSVPFGSKACLFAALLPGGLWDSPADAVAQAAFLAVLRYDLSVSSVIQFVFSLLTAQDELKAVAVLESLISITPPAEVPALVRSAVMTCPRLAVVVVRVAMERVPGEAAR